MAIITIAFTAKQDMATLRSDQSGYAGFAYTNGAVW
jgi:hypothetical protein